MSFSSILRGRILTPQGFIFGSISYHDKIIAIEESGECNPDAPTILPGFVDLHVHGAGGRDTMEAGDALNAITRTHVKHGTTSLLATTMTAPQADIEDALRAAAPYVKHRKSGHARVLGIHLEGPYINPGKLGAQPDFATIGQLEQVRAMNEIVPIRVITLAPEMNGHLEMIATMKSMGIRIQLGHSTASYEEGLQALEQGASGFTHLYNAMSRLEHRAPGLVGAALAHAEFAEIIPDLLHVHPGAIRTALRSIPRLYCVSDSTAACGMPDGEYMLGRQVVHKCLGGVRLSDGTLAGSTLTLDQALRNLVSIGIPLEDAARRTSTYPADYLGLQDRGRLQVGAWADIVVFDKDLNLTSVIAEGEKIELADA